MNKEVKMVFTVRKRSEISKEKFHTYWKENHGALIRGLAKSLGASKYIQSHLIESPVNEAVMSARGITEVPYNGITEIWFDSMESLIAHGMSPEGKEAATKYVEDESTFIDFNTSSVFMTEEYSVFDFKEDTTITQEVFKHHTEAFSKGDVDEIMKDYTEESVLITNEYTARGLKEIREAFTNQFSILFKPGTYEMTADKVEIIDDTAFIVWHSTNQNATIPVGTDTVIVRNGKITKQTFVALVKEK